MNTHKYISIYNKAWSVEVPTCDKCRERKQPVTILSKYPFGRLSLHIHHPLQTLACINYVFESPLRQKSITVSPESMHSFNRRARYGPGPKPWPGEEKTNSRGHCSLFWCLCVPTLFWMLQSFEGERSVKKIWTSVQRDFLFLVFVFSSRIASVVFALPQ